MIGQITGGRGFNGREIGAEWKITSEDEKWRSLEGNFSGLSWFAKPSDEDGMAIWNHPIDVTFSTLSLQGWPQLLVEVYEGNEYQHNDHAGYGTIFIPCVPGLHKLEVVMFRPQGTKFEEFTAKFLGGHHRYLNSNVILTTDSREGHKVVTTGIVHVELNVIVRGFDKHIQLATPPLEKTVFFNSLCRGCKPHEQEEEETPDDDNHKKEK